MTIKPPPPPPPSRQHDPETGYFLPGNPGNPNGNPANGQKMTSKKLWEHFVAYREDNEGNPIKEQLVFSAREGIRKTSIDKARPMTWQGFALFIGITNVTMHQWRREREDLKECLQFIETALFAHKFEGAAAGVFHANIISRELGLTDKQEVAATVERKLASDDFKKFSTAALKQLLGVPTDED